MNLAFLQARRARLGFSLIEVLIVTALVAVLAALAYPSYAEHMARARRAEVRATLMEVAQYMERYYAANGSYADATLPERLKASPPGAAAPSYTLTLTADAAGYTVTATLEAHLKDACGALALTNTGARSRTGEGLTHELCWR
jgi:type IV pilus assembly protein PilE